MKPIEEGVEDDDEVFEPALQIHLKFVSGLDPKRGIQVTKRETGSRDPENTSTFSRLLDFFFLLSYTKLGRV